MDDFTITIIEKPISRTELAHIAEKGYGTMVKAVVDVSKKIMAVGGEMHADEEQELLEQDSKQTDLWGINIYPDQPSDSWVVFDSMINIRPGQGNRSRSVEDPHLQDILRTIVSSLIV